MKAPESTSIINAQRQFRVVVGEQPSVQHAQPNPLSTSDYDMVMEAPATLISQPGDSAWPQPSPDPLRQPVTLPSLTNEFFLAEFGSHANVPNLNGPNYLPPQNTIIQTPALSSSTQLMFSPPTQFASGEMPFQPLFAPNTTHSAPEGESDSGWAKFTEEFFPEGVDEILNMSSLNEWPEGNKPRTPALTSSTPPMLPQTQPPPNRIMLFKPPFASNETFSRPEGEPMLGFRHLTSEFFPEGVNGISNRTGLNEWPNAHESLPTRRGSSMQLEPIPVPCPETLERIMSRVRLNGRPKESLTRGN
ncbi:hypothetical protein BDV93DRAFT_559347 [Ceratobasidium sp. AG-I]|nr:hypothetical protein BDV93DRAFT_559347 [Ceratobasidium sp. AG-I]